MADIKQVSDWALTIAVEAAGSKLHHYERMADDNRLAQSIEAHARAIEQHEAFRQEVSDAVAKVYRSLDRLIPTDKGWPSTVVIRSALNPFLIAKPDPLVEALCEMDPDTMPNGADADNLRKALAARGLEIREVGQ